MMDFLEPSRQNQSLAFYNQSQQFFEPQVQIPTLVISTFILVIAIVVGFYGNGMTLVASAKSKNCKHGKNNFDTLIVDMAAADFIVCCVFSPIVLHLGYFEPENTRAFCAATLYLGVTCSVVSICTIDVIAIHRQCRVIKNYKGTTGFSSCKAYFIITTLWLFGFSLSTGGYIHTETANQTYTKCSTYLNSNNPETHNFVLFFITPVCLVSFAIVIISYSIIAYAVLKQTKIKSSSAMSSPVRNVAPPLNENMKGEIEATVQAKVQVQALSLDKESKALTMCLAVTISLVICWSPLVTAQIVEFSLGESMAVYQVKIIGITLVCLNSAINPYMYAKNSGHLKEASKKVYHMILKCQCCFSSQPRRTKLKPMGRGNLETNWNKSSHYETDSAHNGLAGPGKVDRAVGPSKSMGHITFTPNTQTLPTDNYVYTISLHKGPHFLASCTGRSAIQTSSNGYDLQESFDTMTENETQVVPMPQNS